MEDNKDTIKIEPKKSVTRGVFFIIYHLGLIGSIIGIFVNAVEVWEGHTPRGTAELVIAFAIGMHFFGNLLYKEYTREDK